MRCLVLGLVLGVLLPLCAVQPVAVRDYTGRVVDEQGQPVAYATVYPLSRPEDGTATNSDGRFRLSTAVDTSELAVISFVGCEKRMLTLGTLLCEDTTKSPFTIVLKEQPVALEETVVEARRTRKSKRKLLAKILHAVYMKLEEDLPHNPVMYRVVSDVKMDADSAAWGMEQMIASVYEQPGGGVDGSDSVQFVGERCKRYCPPAVRVKIDSIYRHEQDKTVLRRAGAIDSGTLVHRALWRMRMDKSHLLDTSDELRRWKMTSEDNTRCVLTYTKKQNYLGIFKVNITENLIVDAFDFTLQSYTVDMDMSLFLPFSIKMKGSALDWVNLLNMDDRAIEKFRLKRGHVHARISNLYRMDRGILYPAEKNLVADGHLEDRKGLRLPVHIRATQQVTALQTQDVQLRPRYRKSDKVPRVLVPVY
jgi:hypothetical protein